MTAFPNSAGRSTGGQAHLARWQHALKAYPQVSTGRAGLAGHRLAGMMLSHTAGRDSIAAGESFSGPNRPANCRVVGDDHHREWIEAIRAGAQPLSNFEYGGPLTETVLAGIVAYRLGQPLDWDGQQLTATTAPAALIKPAFRQGWEL